MFSYLEHRAKDTKQRFFCVHRNQNEIKLELDLEKTGLVP